MELNNPDVTCSTLKVLSIDLDIVLQPAINLYNEKIYNGNQRMIWRDLDKKMQLSGHVTYSDDILRIVTKLAAQATRQGAKVYAIENHDSIINVLTSDCYRGCRFDVTNVDHHHDIYYDDLDIEKATRFDSITMGNWALYLDAHGMLAKYTWVRNDNSEGESALLTLHAPNSDVNVLEADLDALVKDVDIVVLCHSPQWFPPKFNFLFKDLLKTVRKLSYEDIQLNTSAACPNGRSFGLGKWFTD